MLCSHVIVKEVVKMESDDAAVMILGTMQKVMDNAVIRISTVIKGQINQ